MRSWPHRLVALMAERDLSDRSLADLVEPRPEYREQMRARIVKYRGGQKMTPPVAERFAAALQVPVDDLLDSSTESVPAPAASPELLDRLEQRVSEVEHQLQGLRRELQEFLREMRGSGGADLGSGLQRRPAR